jgi:hypothetical protein
MVIDFFMLISINSRIHNNQTEPADIQKDSLVIVESLQKQDLSNDDNKLQPRIITNPVTNCGINPNAPPCCTPGEDKGCIGNTDNVNILQLKQIHKV